MGSRQRPVCTQGSSGDVAQGRIERRMKKTASVISNISERALGHVLGSKDHLCIFGRRGSVMPDRGTTSQTFEYTVEGNTVRLNCTSQGHVLSWKPAVATGASGGSTRMNDQRRGSKRPALERASSSLRNDVGVVTTFEPVSVRSSSPDAIGSSPIALLPATKVCLVSGSSLIPGSSVSMACPMISEHQSGDVVSQHNEGASARAEGATPPAHTRTVVDDAQPTERLPPTGRLPSTGRLPPGCCSLYEYRPVTIAIHACNRLSHIAMVAGTSTRSSHSMTTGSRAAGSRAAGSRATAARPRRRSKGRSSAR